MNLYYYFESSRLYRWEGFRIILVLFLGNILAGCAADSSRLVFQSQEAVTVDLKGYNGLTKQTLFNGKLSSRETKIDIPYQGLALLVFSGGQTYPLIFHGQPITLSVKDPSVPPKFIDSEANSDIYSVLSGAAKETDSPPDNFVHLIIRAKQLLESTQHIRTMDELMAKKKEFHEFVRDNYDKLKHSDMIRRLIAQYFIMHEYISYHVEGAPATDILVKYQQAVLDGVASWIEILKPHIPEHEVLNYCVSLYYGRSMVSLASLIVNKFQNVAYCPGAKRDEWIFPNDLKVTDTSKSAENELAEIHGKKTIAFVSEDCPVSMVQTVMEARQLADQRKGERLIVAPLEELSDIHLAMNKMVSNGSMLFINDEKWRKEYLAEKIKLPLFVQVGDDI